MFLTDNRYRDWLVAGIVGALIAGAFALTSLRTSAAALEDAANLRSADLAVAAQDLAMANISRAVGSADYVPTDVADRETAAATLELARTAVVAARDRFENIPSRLRAPLASRFSGWEEAAEEVIVASANGDSRLAEQQYAGVLVPAGESLSVGLLDVRNSQAAAVADTDTWLGWMARLLGFVFIFVLPLAAIIVYRSSAQRQLAEMTAALDVRVAAEAVSGSAQSERWIEVTRELREPVAKIAGWAQQLLSNGELDQSATISELHSTAELLAARLADLQVAVGGDQGIVVRAATVPVARMLDAVIADYTQRGREVGGTYGQGAVSADPELLEQILRNLIDNAIAHGGSSIRVYGDTAGSRYVVAVEDNGPGLPQHVSDSFAAPPDLSTGPGLGLGVSRALAAAMGGSLEYERVAGRTSLVLSLPALEAAESWSDAELVVAEG